MFRWLLTFLLAPNYGTWPARPRKQIEVHENVHVIVIEIDGQPLVIPGPAHPNGNGNGNGNAGLEEWLG